MITFAEAFLNKVIQVSKKKKLNLSNAWTPKKRVSRTLYVKIGKNFKAVGKDDFVLPHGIGDWLIRVRKGSSSYHPVTTTKIPITVDYAKLELAMAEAQEALTRALSDAGKLEPPKRSLTAKEKRAYKAYFDIAGNESLTFAGKSYSDIANLAVKALRDSRKQEDAPKCPEDCLDVFAEKQVGETSRRNDMSKFQEIAASVVCRDDVDKYLQELAEKAIKAKRIRDVLLDLFEPDDKSDKVCAWILMNADDYKVLRDYIRDELNIYTKAGVLRTGRMARFFSADIVVNKKVKEPKGYADEDLPADLRPSAIPPECLE